DDTGATAEDPTTIGLLGLTTSDALVNAGVEDSDDLVVHFDRMRNPDGIAVDGRNTHRDAGLAGAGRAVQEDRGTGNDGRPEAKKEVRFKDQILKSGFQVFAANPHRLNTLHTNSGAVIFQGHRGRAGVLIQ